MRVEKIERESCNVFKVTLIPNWFEKLLGIKPKTRRYKDKGSTYVFGGGRVYYTEDGYETGNGCRIAASIDRYRARF